MLGSRQVGTDKAKYSLRLQHGYGLHFAQNISECLLVALFSSAIQECIQSSSEVFTDLLLQKKKHDKYSDLCTWKIMKLHEKMCLTGFWEMKHADLQWISYEGMHQLHQQTTEVCNRIKNT